MMAQEVSIHARVKRATSLNSEDLIEDCGFNPRPREAGDQADQNMFLRWSSFNPRPGEAGDQDAAVSCAESEFVSIHARVKRATRR